MSGYDYTVTGVMDAPVERVWQVWTEAEHYTGVFHGVPGSAKLDVRPGGSWRVTISVPEAGEERMSGSYVEVVPHRRLVTTMDGHEASPMAMDLKDLGGRTEITFTQTCATAEERDQSEEGSRILLQWCADHLATLHP
ncbi:SRPBCC family protein [Phytohabitans kaempferiae]|uniref:SRPBCC domain-containing protein n=1 Tax=Phytohabitans kaempferiae TaxID=1620943 RepID=A0ABV6M282_9ACTN